MFTEKELCLFRDSIGKLLQQWQAREGFDGATFDHLLNAEEAAHKELVERAKLKWNPGTCGGCLELHGILQSDYNARKNWLLSKIYIDPISHELEATFFCKACNNKVRMVIPDDPSRNFRTG
jgi:hypothetical protein